MLKFSSIEIPFDNLMCVSKPRRSDFNDLPFDGDQRWVPRRRIYCINYDIVERLNNGFIIYVYTDQI